MRKVYVLLTIMFLYTGIVNAQPSTYRFSDNIQNDSSATSKAKINSLDLSLLVGMQNYYGDLSNTNFFPGGSMSGEFNWNVGLKLRYHFSRYFGF